MNQNPIDEVLEELQFTEAEKKGFMKFLNCAKTCQEIVDNSNLKQDLEQVVADIVKRK